MEEMDLFIDEDGTVQTVYSDDLAPLFAGEETVTRRASHVEPAAGGGWMADLAPVGGPALGPFATRRAALDAEVAWIVDALARGRLAVE